MHPWASLYRIGRPGSSKSMLNGVFGSGYGLGMGRVWSVMLPAGLIQRCLSVDPTRDDVSDIPLQLRQIWV